MGKFRDLAGIDFGRWHVDFRGPDTKHRQPQWRCTCSCKARTRRFVKASALVSGKSRSCSCLSRELASERVKKYPINIKHGKCRTKECRCYYTMHVRCYDETDRRYSDYGGRGIGVCAGWSGKQGSTNFLADMGPKPSKKHQIDRKDNNGGYWCGHCEECLNNRWPANCHWATPIENANNKRNSRRIVVDGVSMTIAAAAKLVGMKYSTLIARLDNGMTDKEALETPARQYKRRKPKSK